MPAVLLESVRQINFCELQFSHLKLGDDSRIAHHIGILTELRDDAFTENQKRPRALYSVNGDCYYTRVLTLHLLLCRHYHSFIAGMWPCTGATDYSVSVSVVSVCPLPNDNSRLCPSSFFNTPVPVPCHSSPLECVLSICLWFFNSFIEMYLQFTYLKCIIQCFFSIFTKLCSHHHNLMVGHFHCPRKETLCPFAVTSSLPPAPVLGNHYSYLSV